MKNRLWDIAKPFLKVGTFGFGGGYGMLALIRRECVTVRKWLGDDEMAVAVALGQMVPGPYVPHYAQYIGNHRAGWRGATTATIALLAPSFLIMIVLSWIFLRFESMPGLGSVIKGVSVIMTSIIIWAAYDMGRVLLKNWKSWVVFGFSLCLFLLKADPVLTVLASGVVMLCFNHIPSARLLAVVPIFAFDLKKSAELFWIFFKTGAVIFGGGYASIPFIEQEVCTYRHWLTQPEFLAGMALGQVTPGPVAITATFVGFKVMGILGALLATVAIFLPSFIMLQVFIRIYKKIEHNRYVISLFDGIKAAVVAVLLSTGISFAMASWNTIPAAGFGLIALTVLIIFKIQPLFLIAAGVLFGLIAG